MVVEFSEEMSENVFCWDLKAWQQELLKNYTAKKMGIFFGKDVNFYQQ